MTKYYTRACNFFYGSNSKKLVKEKLSLPLCGDNAISFNQIEIFVKDKKKVSSKVINIKSINKLPAAIKIKILRDIKNITSKREFLKTKNHMLMGVLNLTPDSFSDGGKYNSRKLGEKHAKRLIEDGCGILDIGGEATNPGSNEVSKDKEWKRVFPILKKVRKFGVFISLDTRKSILMKKGIKNKINLVNDVSGLDYDPDTIQVLKDSKIPFVLQHTQGNPKTMQKNPKYKNVVLDIYDFFEKKIQFLRLKGIKHNNIILDP